MPMTDEWQPIETAPKDGTMILLAEISAKGSDDFQRMGEIDIGCWEFVSSGSAGYRTWTSNYGRIHEPTHWLPAPKLPSDE